MRIIGPIFKFLQFNKKNWKAVVLSVAAATVFWFFNALNKTYTTNLSFPIEFHYDQDNFKPISDLPTEVKMNVTGIGWSLLKRSIDIKVPPLNIPLERPSEVKKILGSTLPILLVNQLADITINFVSTDTLYLDIEPVAGRWLSLKLEYERNMFRKGYGVSSNVTLTPDSAFVQGPKKIIDELQEPYPIRIGAINLHENVESSVAINLLPYEGLSVEPPTVNVSFRVEPLTEIRDSVRVEVVNIPKNVHPVISIRKIHYTLLVPQSFLHSGYSNKAVRATLDLKKIKNRKSTLAPILSGCPPFSRISKIDSVEVSY